MATKSEIETFARDPIGEIDAMMGPDSDGEHLDLFEDAFRSLQLRLSGQEIKRRGVLRVQKRQDAPLVVVSCGKSKRDTAAQARDLYTGGVFCAHRTIAESLGGVDYIVSAKHGVIRGDATIAPYDHTITDKSPAERRRWASRVAKDLCRIAREGETRRPVVLLAGRSYAGFVPELEACGVAVFQPLAGMQAGQRRRAARKIADGVAPPPFVRPWKEWAAQ